MSYPRIVVGVPRLGADTFVLVRQYRRHVGQQTVELPAGHVEPNEAPAEAMYRELREETGYEPISVVHIGSFFTAPHATSELTLVYFCELNGQLVATKPNLDSDEEGMMSITLTSRAIDEALSAGHIPDAKSIAAWYLYCARTSR